VGREIVSTYALLIQVRTETVEALVVAVESLGMQPHLHKTSLAPLLKSDTTFY